jgi:hypothetical protein
VLPALQLTHCTNHCCDACISNIHPCEVQAVTNDWQQGLDGAMEIRIGTAAAAAQQGSKVGLSGANRHVQHCIVINRTG